MRLGQRAPVVDVHVLYRERTLEERTLWMRTQGRAVAADGGEERGGGAVDVDMQFFRDVLGLAPP